MTAEERKPTLEEETAETWRDLTAPDDDSRTPEEFQNGEPHPQEAEADPGANTDEFQPDEPQAGEADEFQPDESQDEALAGEPDESQDEPQAGETDEPQAEEPDEPRAEEPDELQAEEPDEPQAGELDEAQAGGPENPSPEELPHDESQDGQPNAAETQEDVNGKPEVSAVAEESAEAQTEGQGETQAEGQTEAQAEAQAEEPEELKMVLHVKDGRANAAVWRSGADPHLETFPETSNLEDLLPKLPGMIERANSRWAESPMRPSYKPAKAPRKKARAKSQAGATQAGNTQQTPEPSSTQRAGPRPEPTQTSMPRLF